MKKGYRKWKLGKGAYGVEPALNFDVSCTKKHRPLTIARLRRVVAKLRATQKKIALPCGCIPNKMVDGRIAFLIVADCRIHNWLIPGKEWFWHREA